jgi:hypothetical protein
VNIAFKTEKYKKYENYVHSYWQAHELHKKEAKNGIKRSKRLRIALHHVWPELKKNL